MALGQARGKLMAVIGDEVITVININLSCCKNTVWGWSLMGRGKQRSVSRFQDNSFL